MEKENEKGLPTNDDIKSHAREWAEVGSGHGNKYFADCNFQEGAKWMRDLADQQTATHSQRIHELESQLSESQREVDRLKELLAIRPKFAVRKGTTGI